jgi:ATP-binding cassette subfamily B protein
MKKLFKWAKNHWFSLVVLILLQSLLQFLYSYLPILISFSFNVLEEKDNLSMANEKIANVKLPKKFIEIIIENNNVLKIILFIGLSMVLLQAFRSILRFSTNYLCQKINQNIQKEMRIKLYNHISDLGYSFHKNVDIGDLIQRATSDVETSSVFLSQQFPGLIDLFVTILVGALQVYLISKTLMWVSLIIIPICGISSIIYFLKIEHVLDNVEKKEARMTTIIQENINGARIVRAFSNEAYEVEKMNKANLEYKKSNLHFMNIMSMYWGISDFIVILQYALTVIVGIYLNKSGSISSADIIACILLMNMLIWPIRGLGRIVSNFGKASVASRRIEEILSLPSEYVIDGALKPIIKGNIEFKNVSFKFDDSNTDLIKDASFKINQGETIAIIGKTGSGKSTICNILTRMLEPSKGTILIDGIPLKDINKKHLRKNIRMVLQNPFLYSKTLYENIAISNKDMDREIVDRASKMSMLSEEIESFEKGYKTMVGEKGATLSGGQKQRVAIARILVDNAPVLIFDDSLSALDTKTDLMVRNQIKQSDRNQTMIIITHRITTAKECDKIIVLDNNSVADVGTHEELSKRNGFYKDLWDIQSKLLDEFNNVLGEVK